MELKRGKTKDGAFAQLGLNRTFMELKLGNVDLLEPCSRVLIVPLWN